jgi:hypothetical protein
MKKITFLCSLFLLLTSLNCSKKEDNPVAPDVPKNDIFFYDSFEENGTGSLQNWSYCDSTYDRFFSFSTDVPDSSSKYSLCIENDSIDGPYIYRMFRDQSSSHQRNLILDFWAKGEGGTALSVDFVFYGATYGFSLLMDTDPHWIHVIDTLHDEQNPYTPAFDSLKVTIGGVNYYANNHKIFLDEFSITEVAAQ